MHLHLPCIDCSFTHKKSLQKFSFKEAMSGSDGCIGEGGAVAPPTVDPTTPGPTTPPPTGTQRTVVFLYGQTVVGEDMFVRGGISHHIRTEPGQSKAGFGYQFNILMLETRFCCVIV